MEKGEGQGPQSDKWIAKLEKLRKEKKLKRARERQRNESTEDLLDSKKKVKKKKKSKRKSHHKKDKPRWKKSKSSDSDSVSDTDGGGTWVESANRASETKSTEEVRQRDAWMLTLIPSTKVFRTGKDEVDKSVEAELDEYDPTQHALELNHFWKDGGSGLPTELKDEKSDPELGGSSPYISEVTKSGCHLARFTEANSLVVENLVTDTELNKLGARATRAELMGDNDLAAKLRNQLEDLQARKAAQDRSQVKSVEKETFQEETILLTHSNRCGDVRPMSLSHNSSERRRRGKDRSYGIDGKRAKYFADDDEYSLQDLVIQEKRTSADDLHRSVNRMAGRYLEKMGADHTLDDMFVSTASQRAAVPENSERDKARALQEHRQLIRSKLSIDSPELEKQLIVCIGMKVYLAVPFHQPLVPGHCQLIPTLHYTCTVNLDEDVWAEVKVFRKGLVAMFASQYKDVIFIEMATHLRQQPHMVLDCIPVPKDQGHLAPLYFKKAILECESEWAQNKKLIDTRHKELRQSVPRGFPYFSVEFGLDGGYAHVIENEANFPLYFGKEIIGGMLELDPRLWRKPLRESADQQNHRAQQIGKTWEKYDWTKRLVNKK
ncbi:CWF19-like protein 2 [Corticium candelabrum]|uniref:CWF19-like protein 2 n=1 Tax=Corticium candelabrum TaxID=121492 RepID=UPI002E26D735|nr:CWF19-like protein 2 [Corticium candelabrum]